MSLVLYVHIAALSMLMEDVPSVAASRSALSVCIVRL